jgi:hypothetical protein
VYRQQATGSNELLEKSKSINRKEHKGLRKGRKELDSNILTLCLLQQLSNLYG